MERATREAMDPNLRHKPRLLSKEELLSWLFKDKDKVRKFFSDKIKSKWGFTTRSQGTSRAKLSAKLCTKIDKNYVQ